MPDLSHDLLGVRELCMDRLRETTGANPMPSTYNPHTKPNLNWVAVTELKLSYQTGCI